MTFGRVPQETERVAHGTMIPKNSRGSRVGLGSARAEGHPVQQSLGDAVPPRFARRDGEAAVATCFEVPRFANAKI